MKICHFISIVSACLALFGCATQQPTTKGTPGAILKPEDIPSTESAVPVSSGDKQPKFIRGVNAVYPLEERKKGIVGIVTVQFIVDTNGKVVSAKAISYPDQVLAKAAVDAISQWEFLPGEKNGRKVNTRLEETITFDLNP